MSILRAILLVLTALVSPALAEQLAALPPLSDNKALAALAPATAVPSQAPAAIEYKADSLLSDGSNLADDMFGLEAVVEGAVSLAVLLFFTVFGRSSLSFIQGILCKVWSATGVAGFQPPPKAAKVVEDAPSSAKPAPMPAVKPAARPAKALPATTSSPSVARPKGRSQQAGLSSGARGALNTETDALAVAVRSGRAADLPRLLRSAQRRLRLPGNGGTCGETQAGRLLLSALRVCVARHCFQEGLVAYDEMAAQIGAGCGAIWSMLLYSAVEAGTFQRCPGFYERLRAFAPPSSHDYVNMVRYHSQRRDPEGLRGLLLDLRGLGCQVTVLARNRGLAAASQSGCTEIAEALLDTSVDPCGEPLDAIGFNTLMKGRARMGQLAKCLELRADMERMGVAPSEVTFGILLDACVKAGDLAAARDLFGSLVSTHGLRPNAVHYTTLIKGLVAGGCLDEATSVLREMRTTPSAGGRGVAPDIVTYSTLVKAHADRGDVRSALCVLEDMLVQGIKPDLIIFNAMLGGAKDREEVRAVLVRIATSGLRASGTTLSIALRALLSCGAVEEAEELLNTAMERLGVTPERRLFEQMAQARQQRAA